MKNHVNINYHRFPPNNCYYMPTLWVLLFLYSVSVLVCMVSDLKIWPTPNQIDMIMT